MRTISSSAKATDFRLISVRCCLLLLALFAEGAQAASSPTDLTQLFADSTRALTAANTARARLLAPDGYSDAAQHYKKAQKNMQAGGSLKSIRRDLLSATVGFTRASKAADLARQRFGPTLSARDAATDASAGIHAEADWKAGEVALKEAAKRLEAGREKSALEYSSDAEAKFRKAELSAIKSSFLDETRALLIEAKKLRADRYAAQTYASATQLLSEAEQQLEMDRYDTDRARNTARQAKHEAYHSMYLAGISADVRKGDRTTETVMLDWETSLRRLGDVLDTPLYFDNGQAAAMNTLIAKVTDMNALVERLAQDLGEREAQVAVLDEEVTLLNKKLGGEAAAVQSLNAILQKQEQHRQRTSEIENSYLLSEAEVMRQGNDVILRVVGLSFDSGSSKLKSEHTELLLKLRRSADVFPRATMSIEGHTDSYGSDTANLALSEARALAIKNYLVNETGMDKLRITSVGYGESQPVANNETADGRAKNRRIDVVIRPFDQL